MMSALLRHYDKIRKEVVEAMDMPLPMGKVRDDALKALAKGDWDSARKAGLTSSERREVEMGKLYKKDVERLGLKISPSAPKISTKETKEYLKKARREMAEVIDSKLKGALKGKELNVPLSPHNNKVDKQLLQRATMEHLSKLLGTVSIPPRCQTAVGKPSLSHEHCVWDNELQSGNTKTITFSLTLKLKCPLHLYYGEGLGPKYFKWTVLYEGKATEVARGNDTLRGYTAKIEAVY